MFGYKQGFGYLKRVFSPADITGLQLWLDASQISGLSNDDAVATWADESGNDNDATQGTNDYRPVYKTNILNGKPVVRFDGTDDRLSTPVVITSAMWQGLAAYTFIFVGKVDSFAAQRMIYGLRQTTEVYTYGNIRMETRDTYAAIGAAVRDNTNKADNVYSGRTATTDYAVYTLNRATGTGTDKYDFKKNGAAMTVWASFTGNITGASFANAGGFVGARGSSNGSFGFFLGDMAEIIVYNKNLTSGEMTGINQYLSGKYNISLS